MEYLFTVWVILTLNFFLSWTMPGEPFLHFAAEYGQEAAVFSSSSGAILPEYYGSTSWLFAIRKFVS